MASVPMIEPSHVVGLPRASASRCCRAAFALLQGGQLWKVRMPLPAPDPDEVMPADLQQLAGYMRQSYSEATQWWGVHQLVGLAGCGLARRPAGRCRCAEPGAVAGADDGAGNEAVP